MQIQHLVASYPVRAINLGSGEGTHRHGERRGKSRGFYSIDRIFYTRMQYFRQNIYGFYTLGD